MKGMSAAQREVYAIIEAFWAEHQISPTLREILKRSNYASTSTIRLHVRELAVLGYVRYDEKTPRSIRITACEVTDRGAA